MGKYVSNISEIILDAIDLEQLISEYVPLKRAGTNLKGLCPFHNEKTPSFVVSKEKQYYHCFGCGASGNAIGFIMAVENLDFLDAIERLADKGRIDLSQYLEQPEKQIKTSTPIQNPSQKKKYYEISKHAARFFYANLKKSDTAKAYIQKRGLTEETIKTFGLGYAPDEWRSLLDYLGKPPYTPEELETCGMVIKKENKNDYYDRFRDRLIFPIIDVQGRVIGFGGRIMGEGQPKYLNSPETPIFNKSNTLYNLNLAKNVLNEEKVLIVVEGYMDVIALYQAGIKNVVATLGTALTSQHGRLLKRYADEIIIAYDSDTAGQKATERSVEILEAANLRVRVLQLTDGLDPDEYLKKYGLEILQTKLKKALSFTDYKIHLLRQSFNLNYEDDRRRFYEQCVALIKPMPESALKDKYVKDLAKWTRLSEESVRKDVFKASQDKTQNQKSATRNIKRSKTFIIETRLLYLALLNKESFDKIFELVDFDGIQDFRVKKIFKFLIGYYQVLERFSIEDCIDHLSIDEIKFIQLLLEKSIAAENLDREIQLNSINFKIEVLNQEIIMILNEIMVMKETDEISEIERETYLKALNLRLVELKKKQAELIKALGR
ncbi:MAG: DNA primase [Clostridia bacterium]|nr:DNA primase [Clostridia bacterium]